jgi:hypothetical protein
MSQRTELNQVKFDKENLSHLEFLTKNVREFYSKDIAVWQYENGIYATGLFFAREKDACIASQGMIPVFLNIKGTKTITAKSESSFLLPEFRGRGIFEDLYFHTIKISEQDDIQIVWGFTALSSVWRKKLKFDVIDGLIHETELQIDFLKSFSAAWKSEQSFINKIKLSLKAFISLTKSKKLPKANKEFSTIVLNIKEDRAIMAMIELYDEWASNHPHFTSIALDKEYLNWRITNNPIIKYKLIGVYKNQKLIGIGIVNDAVDKAYLLDFIVPKKEHLKDGFIEILRHLKQHNSISHLVYWASHTNSYAQSIHSLFQAFGANCYVNNNMNFVIKKTEKCTMPNIEISDIYINGLWTEGFKI